MFSSTDPLVGHCTSYFYIQKFFVGYQAIPFVFFPETTVNMFMQYDIYEEIPKYYIQLA